MLDRFLAVFRSTPEDLVVAEELTYNTRKDGGATVFETTPSKVAKSWFMLAAAVVTTGWAINDTGIGSLIFMVVGGLCWLSFFRDPRREKAHRQPATFRVSADGIQAGSSTYRRSDIEGIRLENRFAEWSGAKGPLDWIAASRTSAVRKSSFFLELHTGGSALVLAGGLNQATATALLNEVNAILGPRPG